MPPFSEKYTNDQREAAAIAREDRGKPLKTVCELARNGELTLNGQPLEPFTISPSYVSGLARALRRRRNGELTSKVAQQPPEDAREAMRRRLISAVDREMGAWEKTRAGTGDLERLRQIIRCAREAVAMPGPSEPRPAKPGQMADGQRNGGETTGGLAAQIIRSARRAEKQARDEPAHDASPHDHEDGEQHGASEAAPEQTEQQHVQTDSEPGLQGSERYA